MNATANPFRHIDKKHVVGVRLLPQEPGTTAAETGRCAISAFLGMEALQQTQFVVELEFRVPGKDVSYMARGRLRWLNFGGLPDLPEGIGLDVLDVVAKEDTPKSGADVLLKKDPPPTVGSEAKTASSTPQVSSTQSAAPQAQSATATTTAAPKATPAAPAAPPKIILPQVQAVADLLSGLLGSTVDVAQAPGPVLPSEKAAVTGSFVSQENEVLAAWQCDLPFACYASGAFSLLPSESIEAAIKEGTVTDAFADNFREIINVGASLFNVPGSPHLKLLKSYPSTEALPKELTAILQRPAARLDLSATIPGYGKGHMAIYSA